MIEIKSASFSKNPCYTEDLITISVEILYEEDKYVIPTLVDVFVSDLEAIPVTVKEETVLTDGEGNLLIDHEGNFLSDE